MVQKKMSTHGAVNIPVQIRRDLGLQPKDVLELEERNGEIVIRPRERRCTFCGTDEKVGTLYGRGICLTCAGKAAEILKGGTSC